MMLIRMTAERLRAMADNGMALWWTPGAERPYWAHMPAFSDDVCVAVPYDFVVEAGFDTLDGFEPDEVFELDLCPPPRRGPDAH